MVTDNDIYKGSCSKKRSKSGCTTVKAKPSSNLYDIGGFKICGLSGGKSFLDMQRPIDMEGNCPNGFKACNPEAEPDNRICT